MVKFCYVWGSIKVIKNGAEGIMLLLILSYLIIIMTTAIIIITAATIKEYNIVP